PPLGVGLLPPRRAALPERHLGRVDAGTRACLVRGAPGPAYVAAPRHEDPGQLGAPVLGDGGVGGAPAATVDDEVAPIWSALGRALGSPVARPIGSVRHGVTVGRRNARILGT